MLFCVTRCLQSVFGCKAHRTWSSFVQFMNVQAIALTLSHVRFAFYLLIAHLY